MTENCVETRPWGSFETLRRAPGYLIKRILVHPQGRLSLQKHQFRSEHWILIQGTARVTVGDSVRVFTPFESVDIPRGVIHRLENVGECELELVELQFGDRLMESDMVRFEDAYGRAASV